MTWNSGITVLVGRSESEVDLADREERGVVRELASRLIKRAVSLTRTPEDDAPVPRKRAKSGRARLHDSLRS